MDSGSDLYHYISSSPTTAAAIVGFVAAGLALVIYMIKNKN